MATVYIDEKPVEIKLAFKTIGEVREALKDLIQNGENLFLPDNYTLYKEIVLILERIGGRAQEPMEMLEELGTLPSKMSVDALLDEGSPADNREFESEMKMAEIREKVAIMEADRKEQQLKLERSTKLLGETLKDGIKKQVDKYVDAQKKLAKEQESNKTEPEVDTKKTQAVAEADRVVTEVTERMVSQLVEDGLLRKASKDEEKVRQVIRQRVEEKIADGSALNQESVPLVSEETPQNLAQAVAEVLETPVPIVENKTENTVKEANKKIASILEDEQKLAEKIVKDLKEKLEPGKIAGAEEDLTQVVAEGLNGMLTNQMAEGGAEEIVALNLSEQITETVVDGLQAPIMGKQATEVVAISKEVEELVEEVIGSLDKGHQPQKGRIDMEVVGAKVESITLAQEARIARAIENNLFEEAGVMEKAVAEAAGITTEEARAMIGSKEVQSRIKEIQNKTTEVAEGVVETIEKEGLPISVVGKKRAQLIVQDQVIEVAGESRKTKSLTSLDEKIASFLGVEPGSVVSSMKEKEIAKSIKEMAQKRDKVVIGLVTDIEGSQIIGIKAKEYRQELELIISERVDLAIRTGIGLNDNISPIDNQAPTTLVMDLMRLGVPETDAKVYVKKASVDLEKNVTNNGKILLFRKYLLEDDIETRYLKANPNATPQQREAITEFKRMVGEIFFSDQTAEDNKLGAVDYVKKTGVSPVAIKEGWNQVKATTSLLKMGPQRFQKFVAKYENLNKILGNKLPKISEIRNLNKVVNLIRSSPKLERAFQLTQRFVQYTGKINGIIGGVAEKFGWQYWAKAAVNKFGGQMYVNFYEQSLQIMGKEGLNKGFSMIMKGVVNGGVKAAATAGETALTAGKAVATVAAEGGVAGTELAAAGATAATGVGIPIAAILAVLAGVQMVYSAVIKPIFSAGKKVAEKLADSLGLDTSSFQVKIKKFVSQDLGLGDNIGSSVLAGGMKAVGGLALLILAIPTMMMSVSMVMIGPVVALFFIGTLLFSQVLQEPPIAGLIPPIGMGGGCVISDTENEGSGEINCNRYLPEMDAPGIEREKFFTKAEQWREHGRENAELCYNDVVCRSRSKGYNPAVVLWVWLHESGASNYKGFAPVEYEDFGIHKVPGVPTNNFDKQINYFLTTNPGCAGLPFWLGFSTNYLTGGCDPKAKVIRPDGSFVTGEMYLAEMIETFSWISDIPLENSQFRIPGTGEDCGQQTLPDGASGWCENETGGTVLVAPPEWEPGPVPEGCPDILPVNGGRYTQGPFAQGCSHQNMSAPAIDIGVGAGEPIYATHNGQARAGSDSIYGNYVEVRGVCDGVEFTTRYAHMPRIPFTGIIEVKKGDQIGEVDTTGSSTGNHIHYHIVGLPRDEFCKYLGFTDKAKCDQLWGCCGDDNGVMCPPSL